MPETGRFRGAGGAEFDLSLPLAENFQTQVDRGQLVRVGQDAAPKRPAQTASKNEWVGYAVHVDPGLSVDDADAMTKADLIEKFGK